MSPEPPTSPRTPCLPPRTRCLEDLETLAFVDGSCAEDQRAEILGHVECCALCRELIASLLGSLTHAEPPSRPSVAPETLDIQGPYRVLGLLAEGGMGRIYRARDLELDREVAIKVPRSKRPALLQRFEREATITARLQHPGVVAVHGAGTLTDGTPFYVMRFIDGTPLDVLLAGASEPAARLALVERVIDVAHTMAYVHAQSVAHRDLKPNNILISQFDETLIIDWGLAKEVAAAEAASTRSAGTTVVRSLDHDRSDTPEATEALTLAGDVLGTPGFMAPEQAAGRASDQRADVYALGGILCMVMTGELPLIARARGSTGDAPAALVAVWTRAMAHDPAERFAEAGAFAAALRVALAPEPLHAPRRRPRWLTAGLIALVTAAGAGVAWELRTRTQPASSAASPVTLVDLGRAPSQLRSLTVSPSGNRIAYANFERIEVRDLVTSHVWSRFGWTSQPATVEFIDEEMVSYAAGNVRDAPVAPVRWNIRTDAVEPHGPPMQTMHWLGQLATGELVSNDWGFRQLEILTASGPRAVSRLGRGGVMVVAISPSRRAFAFIDAKNPHIGVVRVVDDQGHEVAGSPELPDVTAVAWLDDHTLLFATGSMGNSTVYRADATAEGLARARPLYTDPERGRWIAALAIGGSRIVSILATSTFESRFLRRDNENNTALDALAVSAVLGWYDADSYYTWNRNSEEIELRHLDARTLPVRTGSKLHGDPANATRAGIVIIAALRAVGGRQIEAIAVGEATPRWTRPPGVLELVRCAGDVAEPCVAGVTTPAGTTELRRIDPATGTLGELIVAASDIADAAIDRDGRQLAWLDGVAMYQRALDAPADPPTRIASLSSPRTIAFDPTGGILASVSDDDSRDLRRYQGGRVEVLVRSPVTTLSLVRPSPDGAMIGYRTRTLDASLGELRISR